MKVNISRCIVQTKKNIYCFSGCGISEGLNMLKHLGMASISDRTFRAMQACYLIPAVSNTWHCHQNAILNNISESVKLSGDGRCDSPGHTAKYGSYTLMDMSDSHVLHQELVQVRHSLLFIVYFIVKKLSFNQISIHSVVAKISH